MVHILAWSSIQTFLWTSVVENIDVALYVEQTIMCGDVTGSFSAPKH
jgi:hypothetical protein